MKASKVIQIAWKGLAKNKLRSLLTMLGVIIGVSAVIIMIAISAGAEATIEEAVAVSAEEALEIGLIDFIARDIHDLLSQLDGYTVGLCCF